MVYKKDTDSLQYFSGEAIIMGIFCIQSFVEYGTASVLFEELQQVITTSVWFLGGNKARIPDLNHSIFTDYLSPSELSSFGYENFSDLSSKCKYPTLAIN